MGCLFESRQVLKVYGPYISKKDGRKRIIIRYSDKSMSVRSYARFLYQQEHGEIDSSLTVDHIDEDFTNDSIENLQPLSRVDNALKAVAHGKMGFRKYFHGTCSECGEMFTKYENQVKHNRKMGKAGPFCSRKCAGTYSQKIQNNGRVAQQEAGS